MYARLIGVVEHHSRTDKPWRGHGLSLIAGHGPTELQKAALRYRNHEASDRFYFLSAGRLATGTERKRHSK
jgi:hypothetical protein